MRHVLIGLLALLFSLTASAQTYLAGVYYNPARDGEGATVFVRDGEFAMFFYSYLDNMSVIPPTVSPYIPPAYVAVECVNTPIWYLLQGSDWDGEAGTGEIYVGVPGNYPASVDGQVATSAKIGTFFVLKDREGFDLTVLYENNGFIPAYMSIYSTTYQLWEPLAQIEGTP